MAQLTALNLESSVGLPSGRTMPILGLGTWQLTHKTAETIVRALELGYRMIDTSGDYGTQPGIGDGLKMGDFERDSIYIVTKVEENEDAYEATKQNLSEMELGYADLMLIHRPPTHGSGEELWQGLIRAKNDGLTKDIGVSNYSIEQIQQLADDSGEMPAVNQIEWSPFGYSDDVLEFCEDHGVIIQAYSPLTRAKRLDDDTLQQIGDKHDKSPAQILVRWNLQHGTVPLSKANSHAHLEENLDVFDFSLDEEEMEKLDSLNEYNSALGGLPYVS